MELYKIAQQTAATMQKPSGRLEVEDYKILKDDADDIMIYNDLYRLKLYQGDDVTVDPDWESKAFSVPEIHRAAFIGDLKELSTLAKKKEHVNLKIKDGPKLLQFAENYEKNYVGFFVGTTPLMIASERGNNKAVRILLQHGALVNAADSVGLTAFAWACASNRKSTCELLLSQRALIDIREDRAGMSPLLLACRRNLTNITKWLLGQGANVHSRDSKGRSALHFASWNYNMSLMTALVECGAQVNTKDRAGMTPLHLLVSEDAVYEPLELERGMSELEKGRIEQILEKNKTLSKHGVNIILDINRSIPRGLGMVTSCEEYLSLQKLVFLGANVNMQDKTGATPLHTLATRLPKSLLVQDFVICTAPKLNQSLLVQMTMLQRFGAKIDRTDLKGQTAADICAKNENWVGAKLLSKYSDNVKDIARQRKAVGRDIWKTMTYCEKEKCLEMAIEKITDDIIEHCMETPIHTRITDFRANSRRWFVYMATEWIPEMVHNWFSN